ncbi:hypothetical protein NDU88_009851 [Pleurodeles waltl]|uniref:Uncharacterized protein n=1 Tax=Pleurodeles waltl TaxID=8319 RepID=A0AAV7QTZ6_PLEWA|nr:hypothetical protein NDU88_009851 [Pleurodeles waltl]
MVVISRSGVDRSRLTLSVTPIRTVCRPGEIIVKEHPHVGSPIGYRTASGATPIRAFINSRPQSGAQPYIPREQG